MRRFILVFGGAAALLVGCLFPSFDELKKNSAAPGDDDDSSESDSGSKKDGASPTSSSTSGASTSSTSGSTTSSSSSSSSSGDATTGSTKLIHCEGKTCTGDTICCSPTGGTYTCDPRATTTCDANDIAECDGAKDCKPGQVCCQAGPGNGGSACRDGSCGDKDTYCQDDDSACPAGKTCKGFTVIGPNGFKVCQ